MNEVNIDTNKKKIDNLKKFLSVSWARMAQLAKIPRKNPRSSGLSPSVSVFISIFECIHFLGNGVSHRVQRQKLI